MKFTVAALLTALTTASFAQNIAIGFPANGASITPGSTLVVEVDRANTLSSSTEIGVVIAIESCGNRPCLTPGLVLGSILYNGRYHPRFQPSAPRFKPPHQNFTVTIPPALARGAPAQLSVFHVSLIGAGPQPFSETKAVILNVN
ncbi:hypothetical protein BYT27DRAFT_7225492 [Phlegmacium glaucopus]|nr:hypothetical protein BYT27DRAFT_7225492 [Phlegmacium glaucopus]